MKVIIKRSASYNCDLNVSTISDDIQIGFTFFERVRILLGDNINFQKSSKQRGVTTIADDAVYSEANINLS